MQQAMAAVVVVQAVLVKVTLLLTIVTLAVQ
jgi:hypothetical protein